MCSQPGCRRNGARLRDLAILEVHAEDPAGAAAAAASAAPSEAEPDAEAPTTGHVFRLQCLRDAARLLRTLTELWVQHDARPGEALDPTLATDIVAVAMMLDMDVRFVRPGEEDA